MAPPESPRRGERHRRRNDESGRRKEQRKRRSQGQSRRRPATASDESREERRSQGLSAGALAELNRENARPSRKPERRAERPSRANRDEYREVEQEPRRTKERPKERKKKRVVSGAMMEEGRMKSGLRGGASRGKPDEWRWSDQSYEKEDFYSRLRPKKNRKKLWIIVGCSVVILIIIIVVAVVVSQKNKNSGNDSGSSSLDGMDRKSIPDKWKNTYLDPWSWYTTEGFNVTFTDQMVGDLPVMGLYSDWDDSVRANDKVPPLDEDWGSYAEKPARGVSIGGWLGLEPFITPSLFDYSSEDGIIDEWTLSQHLGAGANEVLEEHYATFITEDDFKNIAAAGLDHVRLAYGYWAIEVYDGDPYVFRTSWRYLLRGIEWARKYGLRVKLDIHGLPGSQNGWDHSGRYGSIGWLKGNDGKKNADRSLDIHDRLSKFFAQDRYKNVISHYGLANEPRMTELEPSDVVAWTESAYKIIRDNGVKALAVFGDGFMGLHNWQGLMTGYDDMVLDVHQYTIFDKNLIVFDHKKKVEYACEEWTKQAGLAMDPARGYGPTIFAEWSQADTDCAYMLTGVGKGSRWEGDFNTGDAGTSVMEPTCPTEDDKCSCDEANADPGQWSDTYKSFLLMFAEAQMHSFEKGWGWWYWTWKTESAHQWSYEAGLSAGVLPTLAYERDFNCDSDVPDFEQEGLPEFY